jgi:outer membrane receptor protein involved in Fe transport
MINRLIASTRVMLRGGQWAMGALLGIILLNVPLLAQLQNGSISGMVTDPNNAVVVAAQVKLTDQLRGTTQVTTTNGEGFYIFPAVPAATYQVTVEVAGFKTFVRTDIVLLVNQNLTVPATLELGATTQTVTVTGLVSQVDIEKSTVQETVDSTRMVELPLNGRDVLELQGLVNGAVNTGTVDQGATTYGYSVNGGVSWSNNYTLDGGEHIDSFFNSAMPYPNPDALQEFTVQSSNYDAEYGRNHGAQINAVTKSGTNEFHGTAYEFVRNDVFDSRNFFSSDVPPFKRNQFGATFGGPIRKNSSFFFFSWDGERQVGAPSPLTYVSPTAAMRNGDFSSLSTPIIDPTAGTQFPGNIIPPDRLSQPAVGFLNKFVPLGNLPGSLFSGPSTATSSWDDFMVRFDQKITSKDQFFGRYIWSRENSTQYVFGNELPTMYQAGSIPRQSLVLSENHSFTTSLANSFTATLDRVNTREYPVPGFNWQTLGANIPLTVPSQVGWLLVTVPGYFFGTNGIPWTFIRNMFAFDDTLMWVKGKHTMKFGAQISRWQTHQNFEYISDGSAVFTGQFTGDPAADMMLGILGSFNQDSPGLDTLRQSLWGFFAQDDFKATRRLTFNFGLRYDPYLGFRELHGEAATFWPGRQSQRFPTAPSGLLYEGDPGVPPDVFHHDWKNFAPRVGFAWDVFGNQKTSVRGSYGIFYDAIAGIRLNRFPLNQPFLLNEFLFDVPLADPYQGNSPFPYYPPSTPEQAKNFNFVPGSGATSADLSMRTPYTQQWNLTIERQLPASLFLSAAYVGSESVHLFSSTNINPAIYGPGATEANTQQRRIYPWLSNIEAEQTNFNTHYHSFQLLVRRPFSRGFTLNSAYTLSKNTGSTACQGEGCLGPRNPLNNRLDNGPLYFDATHVWSTSLVWDIPAPQGGKFRKFALGGWEVSVIQ